MTADELWSTSMKTADGLRVMVAKDQLDDLQSEAYRAGQLSVYPD